MTKQATDVVIIGAGVMGLLSAYKLRQRGLKVLVVDAGKIGGPQAASSGLTRSVRNDYADPTMAAMAYAAYQGWQSLQTKWDLKLIENSGCLNICNSELLDIDPKSSYAGQSEVWLARDKRNFQMFNNHVSLADRFPQLSADYAVLDIDAGLGRARDVLDALLGFLRADQGIELLEETAISAIKTVGNKIVVDTADNEITASNLVIAAGLGTGQLCEAIEGLSVSMKITPDRPFELKYFFTEEKKYRIENLPVFAFLDVGVYGHPIVEGLTDGVKIGYYHPPGTTVKAEDTISYIDKFVETCLPELSKNSTNRLVTEVDQCYYDMTDDNKFILGYLGENKNIVVAGGFNGTGFKFAPIISDIVERLVGNEPSGYDIGQFSPNRFVNSERTNA